MSQIKATNYEIQPSKNSANRSVHTRQRLENEQWIPAIKGLQGAETQRQALEHLRSYWFTVVYRYLLSRQPSLSRLADAENTDIATLAQDVVQTCFIKLCRNDYALLDQYAGAGTFTGWAAKIALNEARSMLCRVHWSRDRPLGKFPNLTTAKKLNPQILMQRNDLVATLHDCINQLPEVYRIVLVRCVMNGEKARDVARDIERTSQAVYNLINRAKKLLAELLANKEVDKTDLMMFAS